MYKIKKFTIVVLSIIFVLLTIIEFIIYLKIDSNIFGLVYLLISLLIIFLFVPCAYNYKRYYSLARISKLMIIVIIGLFSSYLLNLIVTSNIGYIDSSAEFIKKIKIIRVVLKPIIYLILGIFTFYEFKGEKLIKTISNNNID